MPYTAYYVVTSITFGPGIPFEPRSPGGPLGPGGPCDDKKTNKTKRRKSYSFLKFSINFILAPVVLVDFCSACVEVSKKSIINSCMYLSKI